MIIAFFLSLKAATLRPVDELAVMRVVTAEEVLRFRNLSLENIGAFFISLALHFFPAN